MKAILASLSLISLTTGTGLSQPQTIADHPFFASMIGGTSTETGEMVQAGRAVAGKSTSDTGSVLGGQWLQQDGTAAFGDSSREWRWMFRLVATLLYRAVG